MTNTEFKINKELCLNCKKCVEVCPCRIFRAGSASSPEIDIASTPTCTECGHCIAACPVDAITIKGIANADFITASVALPKHQELASLLMTRRSIRAFTENLVELPLLKELIEVTKYCPTAKNMQNLSWLLINGRDKVLKVSAQVINVFRGVERMAPLVAAFDHGEDPVCRTAPQLAIIYGPEKSPWGTMDASIAMTSFELLAHTHGIGTCWGGFITTAAAADKGIGRELGLSDSEKVFAAMMLGYPKHKYKKVPPRNQLRLRVI